MRSSFPAEVARFSRDAELGFERLTASYVTHSFAPHTHETSVVALVQAGVHALSYRGSRVVAPQGSTVLVNSDERHTGQAFDRAGWRYSVLYPEARLMQQAAQYAGRAGTALTFGKDLADDALLARRITQLHALLDSESSRLEREVYTLETLGFVLARYGQERRIMLGRTNESRAVGQIRQVLDESQLNLNLTELAALVNLSIFQLSRAFKKELGLAPHEYQTQQRVHRATALLRAGESAASVAITTGFYDQSHLNRHFKRLIGVTPGQYQLAFQ